MAYYKRYRKLQRQLQELFSSSEDEENYTSKVSKLHDAKENTDEEEQVLYWPQGVNAEKALRSQQHPDLKSWRKFRLVKVKISSDSYQDCEDYLHTSTVEDTLSSADSDGDSNGVSRIKRKRPKKILPDGFVSSQDMRVLQEVTPAKTKKGISPLNKVPDPPQKLPSLPNGATPSSQSQTSSTRSRSVTSTSFLRRSSSSDCDWVVDEQRSPMSGSSQDYYKSCNPGHTKKLKNDSHNSLDRPQQHYSKNQKEQHDIRDQQELHDSRSQQERRFSRDQEQHHIRDRQEQHHIRDQQEHYSRDQEHLIRDRHELHEIRDQQERHYSRDQEKQHHIRDRQEPHYSWDQQERRDIRDQRTRRDQHNPCSPPYHTGRDERLQMQLEPKDHSFPMDTARFQKRVLQLLLDMRDEMRDVKHEVRDVKSVDRVSSFSDSGIDLTIKRSNTLEELQTVERDLENATYFQEMYSKCIRIGGMNKKDMVSKLLCSFMSKSLLCKYNMQGQRAKIAFKNTKLCTLIRDSVLQKFTDSSAAEVIHIIATKLRNAPKMKETVE